MATRQKDLNEAEIKDYVDGYILHCGFGLDVYNGTTLVWRSPCRGPEGLVGGGWETREWRDTRIA
jgi:hypothetical protein